MAIHLSLEEDDSSVQTLRQCLPTGQVCSTTVTLTPSGSRMPGNYLTVWLAHPRGIPCRRRRVLRVVDLTQEKNDDHDQALLASESYDALRELHWGSYRFCLPFLLDLLSLTPNLQRLHVHALPSLLTRLAGIVPERPNWPQIDRAYTFSLTSFECSGILTGDIIARIIVCSAKTLQRLYLLIHGVQLEILVPMLTETDTTLDALRSLTLLPADNAFSFSRMQRFLLHCPRLLDLAISADYPKGARLSAPHTPRLRSLTLYCANHRLSISDAQGMGAALQEWSGLRTLTMHTFGLQGDDVRDELRRACASARVALRLTVFRAPDPQLRDRLWSFYASHVDT